MTARAEGDRGGDMISARSWLVACVALSLSACDVRGPSGPGAVEQPNTANAPQQNNLIGNLASAAGYDVKTLGPGDPKWAQVFEAGVYEVGRQCDQYLDALFQPNRAQGATTNAIVLTAA